MNSIIDVIDSLDDLRDGNSPRNGKTHRYVGWLTRPVHEWPPYHRLVEESGDTSITLAIGERLGEFSCILLDEFIFDIVNGKLPRRQHRADDLPRRKEG